MQLKCNNSSITSDILMKLHVHHHTIVLYIQYKFDEIPCIGYLVMAEDENWMEERADRWKDGWMDRQTIPKLYFSACDGIKN